MILDQHYQNQPKFAWFYLRDPYYAESLPPSQRANFVSEGPYEEEKLQTLKGEIEKSSYPCHHYNRPSDLTETIFDVSNENYQHSSNFPFQHLSDFINKTYPERTDLTPLQSERFRHKSFTRSHTRAYLANEGYFMQLDKYASSNDNRCFLVVGDSGIGKSALLANWAERYRQHHPENPLITHFIGCSSTSSNYLEMLKRFVAELQDILGDFTADRPKDVDLPRQLPGWLESTLVRNRKSRLVIVIDGLDNLDDRDNAYDLLWLPQILPNTVRIVISLSPGKVFNAINRRGYDSIKLAPLGLAERKSFIRMFLALNSKKLKEEQEFNIASFNQCGNPRYLKTFLEDITTGSTFEELSNRIKRNLTVSASPVVQSLINYR